MGAPRLPELCLLAALLSAACGSQETTPLPSNEGDAGSAETDAGVEDAGAPSCGEAATECPTIPPYPGSPCEGELDCPLSQADGAIRWDIKCLEGAWITSCQTDFLGACGPELTEYCANPFEGSSPGTVEVGPSEAGPFRAFSPNEEVKIEWGPQGLPMIRYALRIREASDIGCILVEPKFTMDGKEAAGSGGAVTLRCGSSLAVLAIVPFDIYEPKDFEMGARFEVRGIGSATATLRFRGGPQ